MDEKNFQNDSDLNDATIEPSHINQNQTSYPEQPIYQMQPNLNQYQQHQPTENDIYIQALADKVEKKQEYFMNEFATIENGSKSRFNKSAFFFNILYCIHRKNMVMFKKIFPIELGIMLITLALTWIDAVSSYSATFETISTFANILIFITSIAASIYCGLKFNETYYKQLKFEIATPKYNAKKSANKAAALFVICIICYFINPSTFYSTFDFESGYIDSNTYINESMDLAFEADDNLIICDNDEYQQMVNGLGIDVEFYVYSTDYSVNASLYELTQTNRFSDTEDVMYTYYVFAYLLSYTNSSYEFVEEYSIAGVTGDLYVINFSNGTTQCTDYMLVICANYATVILNMNNMSEENTYDFLAKFTTVDELSAKVEDDSQEQSQADTDLISFESGYIEANEYINESLGIKFSSSSDIFIFGADEYLQAYGETTDTIEFFGYNLMGDKYITMSVDTLNNSMSISEYKAYIYGVFNSSYYNVKSLDLGTYMISGNEFELLNIYYEDDLYYYNNYYLIKEVDGGKVTINVAAIDAAGVYDILEDFCAIEVIA